jgi:hypothetical protein
MAGAEQQRMILQRMAPDGLSSAEVASRVNNLPNVTVLQESAPSTVLVEGHPDAINKVAAGLSGWSALPITRYKVPDPRPRVLKPASE